MSNLFDGISIWGGQTREMGPIPSTNSQRSKLPGISGFRVYALGTNSWVWNIRGLLAARTLGALEGLRVTGASYVDGLLYNFTTAAGSVYSNCLLNSFQPASEIQPCFVYLPLVGGWGTGFCQYVSGVVEWAGATY